jgi:hypothetical protein
MDAANGNTLRTDGMNKEIANIKDYNTFREMATITYIAGYKKIIVHFVFGIKIDPSHKERFFAGGNLPEPTMEGSYSSVVNLRILRLCLAAAKPNGLDIMVGDISSSYLEAYTCFTAGPEFWLVIPLSSIRPSMVCAHPEQVGINVLQITLKTLGTSHVTLIMTSG